MATEKSSAQLGYQYLQKETANLLKPLGFKRKGSIIFTRKDDNFGVIQFQSSPGSTRLEVNFTVNVGVIIGKLVDPRAYQLCLRHPSCVHAQVRARIGYFLGTDDKWWTIAEDLNISESLEEFSQLMLEKVVPFLQHYMDINNLRADWEQDKPIGLTRGQLARYLAKLRQIS